MNNEPELSLILPVYNEAQNVRITVANIISTLEKGIPTFEIIMVNDGSTDETPAILSELSSTSKHVVFENFSVNQGYGAAILAGLKRAKGHIVGWSDGDGQISPEDILKLYQAMKDSGIKAAKAKRVIRRESPFRKIQSFFFNLIFGTLFGFTTSDVNAKPKLMRREVLALIKLSNRRYFIDAEWVIRLNRAHIAFAEVPIEFLKRTHGKSKIYFWTSLEFVRDLIIYALRLR